MLDSPASTTTTCASRRTVVLACSAPTAEKCDKETDVVGEVSNGSKLSCKSPANFVFKGPYGTATTVTIESDAMQMPGGGSIFTAEVARNGNSCVYNLQWKPTDITDAGGTVATGTYYFHVGDESYSANLVCDTKKK